MIKSCLENSCEVENISRLLYVTALSGYCCYCCRLASEHRLNTWEHSTFHRVHLLIASRMISCHWPWHVACSGGGKKRLPISGTFLSISLHCNCSVLIPDTFFQSFFRRVAVGNPIWWGFALSRASVIQTSWKSLKQLRDMSFPLSATKKMSWKRVAIKCVS